jgi:hypothetical protein
VTRRVSSLPGEAPADTCRRLGWTVGTRLIGDEGNGPTVIRITAIGERQILAVVESYYNGMPSYGAREGNWHLDCRDWQPVGETP